MVNDELRQLKNMPETGAIGDDCGVEAEHHMMTKLLSMNDLSCKMQSFHQYFILIVRSFKA